MRKNTCQFCGSENSKVYETWIKDKFGLICPICQKSAIYQRILAKEKEKKSL